MLKSDRPKSFCTNTTSGVSTLESYTKTVDAWRPQLTAQRGQQWPAFRQSLWYQWLSLPLIAWLGSVHNAWTERSKQTFPLHYPPRSVPCHQILAHVYFTAWSCLLFSSAWRLLSFLHIPKAKRSWRGSNNFFLTKFPPLLHQTTKMDHISWKTIKPINFCIFRFTIVLAVIDVQFLFRVRFHAYVPAPGCFVTWFAVFAVT